MLFTILASISVLLVINFLLLKYSCNKTVTPPKIDKNPIVFEPNVNIIPEQKDILAPTGS